MLIHTAGVHARTHSTDEVMRINAHAPIAVAEGLFERLTGQRKLLLMTSQLGARRGRTGRLGVYGDSKAALNDAFREREPRWRAAGVTSIVLHPGWVRTDMGGASAPVSVEDSAGGIIDVLARLDPTQSGQFLTWEGKVHPW